MVLLSVLLLLCRNFEGRIHPLTRANYLASPLLVIAYALAGTVCIDFETETIGQDSSGQPVFLRDIWPSREEIQTAEEKFVVPGMFREVYSKITEGNARWNSLEVRRIQPNFVVLIFLITGLIILNS